MVSDPLYWWSRTKPKKVKVVTSSVQGFLKSQDQFDPVQDPDPTFSGPKGRFSSIVPPARAGVRRCLRRMSTTLLLDLRRVTSPSVPYRPIYVSVDGGSHPVAVIVRVLGALDVPSAPVDSVVTSPCTRSRT